MQLGAIVFGLAMDWRWIGLVVAWLFTGWAGNIWWDGSGEGGRDGLSGLSGVCKMLG